MKIRKKQFKSNNQSSSLNLNQKQENKVSSTIFNEEDLINNSNSLKFILTTKKKYMTICHSEKNTHTRSMNDEDYVAELNNINNLINTYLLSMINIVNNRNTTNSNSFLDSIVNNKENDILSYNFFVDIRFILKTNSIEYKTIKDITQFINNCKLGLYIKKTYTNNRDMNIIHMTINCIVSACELKKNSIKKILFLKEDNYDSYNIVNNTKIKYNTIQVGNENELKIPKRKSISTSSMMLYNKYKTIEYTTNKTKFTTLSQDDNDEYNNNMNNNRSRSIISASCSSPIMNCNKKLKSTQLELYNKLKNTFFKVKFENIHVTNKIWDLPFKLIFKECIRLNIPEDKWYEFILSQMNNKQKIKNNYDSDNNSYVSNNNLNWSYKKREYMKSWIGDVINE